MPTQRKIDQVAELEQLIERSSIAISGDYRGLSVAELSSLRRRMRESGIEVKVVKNTLFRRAAESRGHPGLVQLANGPTAVMFGQGDGIATARAITEFIRVTRSPFALYGGYAEGRTMSVAQVQELATLPGREALLAQLMGSLSSPAANLAGLLSATLRQFAALVESRATQLEAQG